MRSALIIDDDADVRGALFRALSIAGMEDVRVASGAKHGLAEMRDRPADLVITDMIMPGQDGKQVIAAIRDEFPGTLIVAISGGGALGQQNFRPEAISTCAYLAAAESAGAHATLSKPFDTRELLEALQRATHTKNTAAWSVNYGG
jgi:CheY-like chemotaxis protein